MRRGFKKEARQIALEVRAELGLDVLDPLNPWDLAEHLAIPVWPLSSYKQIAPECHAALMNHESSAFSAMIAFSGRKRVIVHNDSHAPTRQRTDICHEIAHALLLHEPHVAVPRDPLVYDAEQEDEASWLGGVLLVCDEACLSACRRGLTLAAAAAELGISVELMRWRINKSGARQRVERARRRRGDDRV